MKLKDYSNLKEMLIDFNEYSTDYTKTRCRELEETIKNTLKEIERLNNIINELIEDIPCLLEIINRNEKDIKVYQDEWIAIKSVENKLQELKGVDKE